MKATKTKKRLLIITLVLTVLATGCYTAKRPLLMWAYGIHQPRIEDKESLLQATKKFGLDEKKVVTVGASAHRQLRDRFYHSIPEGIIFNREGRFINYKAGKTDCNAGLFSFISQLDKRNTYPPGDSFTLKEMLHDLRDLNGNTLPPSFLDKGADFYLLISWADYIGRLNKDHVGAWQALAGQNGRARIQVIEVNFDVQAWWPTVAKDTMLRGMAI